MLSIRFGKSPDTIYDVDAYFDLNYLDEWMEDPLVKEMVKDVDLSEVQSPYLVFSPVLGQIPVTEISGGVKALILMLKEDLEIWATACGDNCSKWILKIAEMKDLTISLSHFMSFPNNHFSFIDAESGKVVEDYFDEIIKRGM